MNPSSVGETALENFDITDFSWHTRAFQPLKTYLYPFLGFSCQSDEHCSFSLSVFSFPDSFYNRMTDA